MKRSKQRLAALNDAVNNQKRKTNAQLVLLFIAEAVSETNSNIKWLMAMVGVGIAILIALVVRGG